MTIRRTSQSPQTVPSPTTPTTAPSSAPAPARASAPSTPSRPLPSLSDAATAQRLGVVLNDPSKHLATPAPSSSRGPVDLRSPAGRAAVEASLAFLQGPASSLVAPAPEAASFAPRSVIRDELGMTHVRLDRVHDGLKVFGEQVISHLDAKGQVVSLTGEQAGPSLPAVDQAALLGDARAIAVAQQAFGQPSQTTPKAELMYVKANDGQYHAAYKVDLTNLSAGQRPQKMNYFVDATSGQIVKQFNQLDGFVLPKALGAAAAGAPRSAMSSPPTNPNVDDTSLYSGTVEIDAKQDPTNKEWFLQDDSRGQGVVTYDALNKDRASGETKIYDDNNRWGEGTDPERAKVAVDAQYGAQMTYDFYKDVLGRNSIDDKGERLVNYVHLGEKYDNAYWDGTQMQYGDGDGVELGPLASLDVAGHEISHGLTERTAGLIYDGESGGLNEAMSDIFGKGVEWYASQKNPAVKFSWNVGEQIYTPGTPGDALRYMGDPTKDGYSIDNYRDYAKQSEVHGSSGIANNAFYLMVEGGANRTSGLTVDQGMGMEKALKVMYRAETVYFTPSTTFAQAKDAVVKAATDLYGADSPEVKAATQAWTAVGL